jgi:hypothetical protein
MMAPWELKFVVYLYHKLNKFRWHKCGSDKITNMNAYEFYKKQLTILET